MTTVTTTEERPRICEICGFAMLLDDVELKRGACGCICVDCYREAVKDVKRLTKDQRRRLEQFVNALPDQPTPATPAPATDFYPF